MSDKYGDYDSALEHDLEIEATAAEMYADQLEYEESLEYEVDTEI